MSKIRILYVSHEMDPYLELSKVADIARKLPPSMQSKGIEIRAFMPRYGVINERRHRLHEVVRLSGINIMIGDNDNPLIIKVASLPKARIQVYFLDNEDFFLRKSDFRNQDGDFLPDNDERMIFFCKGVMETVVKLGWVPDLIHCNGWMTSLIPLYLKKLYNNNPIFENSKVIYSAYKDQFSETLNEAFVHKAMYDEMTEDDLASYANLNNEALTKGGMEYADGIVLAEDDLDEAIVKLATESNKPVLKHVDEDNYEDSYFEFYQSVLDEQTVAI